MRRSAWCWGLAGALHASAAAAQFPQAPAPAPAPAQQPAQPGFGYSTSGGFYPAPAPAYPSSGSERRSGSEIGVLYLTAAVYGVGVGVWFGAEVGIEDPGLFLIPPAVLGIAAPAGVYFADRPALRRGLPAAIAAGAVIGAGEGIGIASLQFVTAEEEDAWGFRGLSRATALGATLGAGGGLALGLLQRPSPKSSLLMTSGVAWGSAVGAMFGYGASEADVGYGRANDSAALGGLIGYNAGLVATAAVSAVHIPSYTSITWMWAGAGIGFAASLPVFLFYADEGGPPAKRGLVFSGTATTLGIAAAALFSSGTDDSARSDPGPTFARVTTVAPLPLAGGVGLSLGGELF